MTNNKKGGYKVGTVISGAQSVDNNVVPVVSSGKNQSVNGQKFGDIMAKSVGGNAGKKNSSTDTLSQNSIRTNTSSSDKNDVAEKVSSADKAKASDTNKTQNTKTDNKVAEKVDKAANEVYDKIKKTLGVSDEEIQHSMENLGLTMVDLLMPENIMQLVMDITGTQDSMQLVTDDMLSNAMKDIMDFVSHTSQQLAVDLSVTPDDLKEILQSVSIDEKADKNIQTHEENSDVKEDAADSNIKMHRRSKRLLQRRLQQVLIHQKMMQCLRKKMDMSRNNQCLQMNMLISWHREQQLQYKVLQKNFLQSLRTEVLMKRIFLIRLSIR